MKCKSYYNRIIWIRVKLLLFKIIYLAVWPVTSNAARARFLFGYEYQLEFDFKLRAHSKWIEKAVNGEREKHRKTILDFSLFDVVEWRHLHRIIPSFQQKYLVLPQRHRQAKRCVSHRCLHSYVCVDVLSFIFLLCVEKSNRILEHSRAEQSSATEDIQAVRRPDRGVREKNYRFRVGRDKSAENKKNSHNRKETEFFGEKYKRIRFHRNKVSAMWYKVKFRGHFSGLSGENVRNSMHFATPWLLFFRNPKISTKFFQYCVREKLKKFSLLCTSKVWKLIKFGCHHRFVTGLFGLEEKKPSCECVWWLGIEISVVWISMSSSRIKQKITIQQKFFFVNWNHLHATKGSVF